MKISLAMIMVLVAGYILARFFPQPGNMLGLPG